LISSDSRCDAIANGSGYAEGCDGLTAGFENEPGDVEEPGGQPLSANLPVMCSLSDAEKREREATLIARFRSGVLAAEELDDGYSFRLPGERIGWLW